MQENRSFDDLFQGYPKADTQSYGYDSNGNKIALMPVPLEGYYDLEHDIYSYMTDCNGTGSIPGDELPDERLQQRRDGLFVLHRPAVRLRAGV